MERDDEQEVRHASRETAAHARIMLDALEDTFDPDHARTLHRIWWQHTLTASNMPDFEGLLKKMGGA